MSAFLGLLFFCACDALKVNDLHTPAPSGMPTPHMPHMPPQIQQMPQIPAATAWMPEAGMPTAAPGMLAAMMGMLTAPPPVLAAGGGHDGHHRRRRRQSEEKWDYCKIGIRKHKKSRCDGHEHTQKDKLNHAHCTNATTKKIVSCGEELCTPDQANKCAVCGGAEDQKCCLINGEVDEEFEDCKTMNDQIPDKDKPPAGYPHDHCKHDCYLIVNENTNCSAIYCSLDCQTGYVDNATTGCPTCECQTSSATPALLQSDGDAHTHNILTDFKGECPWEAGSTCQHAEYASDDGYCTAKYWNYRREHFATFQYCNNDIEGGAQETEHGHSAP